MQFFISAFFFTLILNIHLYNFFVCILANSINIISFSPKITAPQLIFNFWMKTKKLFCSDTFYRLNNAFHRHHWNTLYQKMNMIFICSNFNKMYFVSLCNIFTDLTQGLFNRFRQNTSSIFYRTNYMIQQQTFIMVLMNMFTHRTNVLNTNPTTEAKLRGII